MKYVLLSLICAYAGIAYGAESESQKPIYKDIWDNTFKGYQLKDHPKYKFIGRYISRDLIHIGAKKNVDPGMPKHLKIRKYTICTFTTFGKLVGYHDQDGYSSSSSGSFRRNDDYQVTECTKLAELYFVFNKFQKAEFEEAQKKANVELNQAKQDLLAAYDNERRAKEQRFNAEQKYDKIKEQLEPFNAYD